VETKQERFKDRRGREKRHPKRPADSISDAGEEIESKAQMISR